jgi:hypothetical protein
MSKWHDFLDGVERKQDLDTLLTELTTDLKLIKPRSLNEEVRLTEIRLKARRLEHENKVLLNKIAILEEDLDL